MAYKLKLLDDGKPVVADGLPVFVDDNGADVAFNPNTLHAKILSLNSESKARREKIESLQERVAALDGIEDVAAFRAEAEKAIDMVKTLGAKDKEAAEGRRKTLEGAVAKDTAGDYLARSEAEADRLAKSSNKHLEDILAASKKTAENTDPSRRGGFGESALLMTAIRGRLPSEIFGAIAEYD